MRAKNLMKNYNFASVYLKLKNRYISQDMQRFSNFKFIMSASRI